MTFRNYQPLGGGPFGVNNIPRPFESLPTPWDQIAFLLLVVAIVGVILFLVQRAWTAPWGRVLRAIRENEDAAEAAGKDVEKFRLQAFILGSMLMGLFGALMAHYVKIISPEGTEPLLVTFLPWVMLIVGGAGNNRGAVVGAILVWGLWTMTELLTGRLPDEWALRVGYLRIFLIGLLLQIVLQKFPGGCAAPWPQCAACSPNARPPCRGIEAGRRRGQALATGSLRPAAQSGAGGAAPEGAGMS